MDSDLQEKREALNDLINQVSEAFEELRYLEDHVKPRIEPRYQAVIGIYEYRVNELKVKILELRRRIQLVQKMLNRQEPVDIASIDQQIKLEFAEYSQNLKRQYQEIEDATKSKGSDGGPPDVLSKEDAVALKRIYKQMVKQLHPDLHQDQSAKEKEFFLRVIEAYKNGDIQMMETLEILFDRDFGESLSDEVDDEVILDEKIMEMEERLEDLVMEKERLLKTYPFTLLRLLDDDEAVRKEQDRMAEDEFQLQKVHDVLQEKYQELLHSSGSEDQDE